MRETELEQVSMSRVFVAKHLKESHTYSRTGCLICTAWDWAREMRDLDDNQVEEKLDAVRPAIEVNE